MSTTPTSSMSESYHYGYGETYQLKILALLVRYPQFVHRYGEVVRPEYFEYQDMQTVAKQILDFHRRYGTVPTRETFTAWLQDYNNRYHPPEKIVQGLNNVIAAVYTCDMSDGDAVKDTAVNFAKRQALKSAIKNITLDLQNFDTAYEKYQVEIQRALMVGQGLGSLGTEVFGGLPRLPQLLSAQNSQYSVGRKILTPFHRLNEAKRGGLGPGELCLIVGSSGQGKSHIMVNFGKMAARQAQGQWIGHVTLELSELDFHLRYGASILGMSMDDIVMNTPEFVTACGQLATDCRIYVKWFPPGETTTGHVRSWVSALSSEMGVGPCMLIIDYPDLMEPTKGSTDSLYINNGKIYSEIITLIHDYNAVGVVNSQLDRYHQNSNQSRGNNVANSIAKLYHVDVCGTINQTEEDKANGIGRIWWDKVRRGRDMFFSPYRIDYARSSVVEDDAVMDLVQGSTRRQPPPALPAEPPSEIPIPTAPVAPPPLNHHVGNA